MNMWLGWTGCSTQTVAIETSPAIQEVTRSNCFDFLRLVAALAVVVSHAQSHLDVPFLWVRPGFGYWFYDGVELFFILSGFLVYRSFVRCIQMGQPVYYYFLNRFLRIAPALYAYTLAFALLVLSLSFFSSQIYDSVHASRFMAWFLLMFALLPISPEIATFGDGGNGSLWTIPAEISFYLVVPFFFLIERRFGLRIMLIVLTVTAIAGLVLRSYLLAIAPNSTLYSRYNLTFMPHILFFGLGVFWSRYWSQSPQHWAIAASAAFVYFLLRTLNVLHVDDYRSPLFALAWSIPLSYSIIWAGHRGPRVLSEITKRVGDLSYSVYIWHMIVVNFAIWAALKDRLAWLPGGLQIFVVGISLALAYVSWHLVEKPALKLKPYTLRVVQA